MRDGAHKIYDPVTLFRGELQPVLISAEEGLLFYLPDARDQSTGAVARDARGRETYAGLALEERDLTLTLPGRWLAEAEYPVVIDPMIGDPALVSDPRAIQGELDAAYNAAAGEYLVVWGGYDTGGASADVQGQRVQADGTLAGDLILISGADHDQLLPAVATTRLAGWKS